jgi:hypothetical protein
LKSSTRSQSFLWDYQSSSLGQIFSISFNCYPYPKKLRWKTEINLSNIAQSSDYKYFLFVTLRLIGCRQFHHRYLCSIKGKLVFVLSLLLSIFDSMMISQRERGKLIKIKFMSLVTSFTIISSGELCPVLCWIKWKVIKLYPVSFVRSSSLTNFSFFLNKNSHKSAETVLSLRTFMDWKLIRKIRHVNWA